MSDLQVTVSVNYSLTPTSLAKALEYAIRDLVVAVGWLARPVGTPLQRHGFLGRLIIYDSAAYAVSALFSWRSGNENGVLARNRPVHGG